MDTFLHSGPAGAGNNDHRHLSLCGFLNGSCKLFTNNFAHAGHHKMAITHGQYHFMTTNPCKACSHRFIKACLLTKSFNFIFIAFVMQRISGCKACIPFLETFLVCQHLDAASCRYTKIVAAFRANILIANNTFCQYHRSAGIAFAHQPFRHLR